MRYFADYIKKNRRYIIAILLPGTGVVLYFYYLVPGIKMQYLQYMIVLLVSVWGLFFLFDYNSFKKKSKYRKELLLRKGLLCNEIEAEEGKEYVIHDVNILKAQLETAYQNNCNLQDYITKWTHEVKIPLATSMLMVEHLAEKNTLEETDAESQAVVQTKAELQEQLQRMNQQLNMVLLGSKMQSNMFDITIRRTRLMDCVRSSIHNNQFFLMKKNFQLDVNVGDTVVYTDPQWLTYVLDQLLSNAVKYAAKEPVLKIWGDSSNLYIEDDGEGIKKEDIRRVFEKGFTGANHHNGQYKSTGMGLYMAHLIIEKLGHDISVESEYGAFTRFHIRFPDNREYYMKSEHYIKC